MAVIVTDEVLRGIAAQSLNMAKRDMEQGQFGFLMACYFRTDTPPLHRMTKVEELICAKLGPAWLNSGGAKDMAFGLIRTCVTLAPPHAVVMAFASNMFVPTPAFHLLPEDRRRALAEGGHDGHHKAVAEGLFSVRDALVAVAQTPERVCQYRQEYAAKEFVGRSEVFFVPQADFDGRLKMFGKGKYYS